MECGWLVSVSRFRKCTRILSPTRARSSGPWSPGLPGSFGSCFAKSFVNCRYATVRKTVCARVNRSPSIAFRPFGATFQVTGTAATQYSRTVGVVAVAASRAATIPTAPTPTAPARAASTSASGPRRGRRLMA